MKIRALIILIIYVIMGAVFLAPAARADYFQPLDTLNSTHGMCYYFIAVRGSCLALGDSRAGGSGLEIIDFSDPTHMISAGYRPTGHTTYNQFWAGNYVYVPCGDTLLQIYDVSNYQNIDLASQINYPFDHASGIVVRGSYALLGCDFNGSGGGLFSLLVENPYRPQIVWSCDSIGAYDFILGQTLAYTYTWLNEIKILDISELNRPVQITRFACDGVNNLDVDESRNLLYVTCFDRGLLIYDISDPVSPSLLSTTMLPDPDPRTWCIDVCHSKVDHQYLFISGYVSGLWAVDVSDPLNPVAVARYFMPRGYASNVSTHGDLVFVDNGYELVSLRFYPETDAVGDSPELPKKSFLSQNYPNPFNRGTTISFSLPAPGNIRLEIYDALGRKVSTLFDGFQAAGDIAVNWDASNLAGGTYFYKLTAPDFDISRKMTVLK